MGKHRGRGQGANPPPRPPRRRPIHHQGPVRDIVFAVQDDGSSPAKEFLESLSVSDQDRFNALFIWMAEHGEIRNPEKFRFKVGEATCKVGDRTQTISIAEFKIHSGSGQRILAFLHGRQWVLTNGFRKGEKLSVQTKRAEQIVCEDLAGRSPPQRT
jgi:hypothetical protein